MNPESSDSNVGSGTSLIEQVQAATKSNPSLARELATFLLDPTPDPQPVTREKNPVFYDATQNPGTYHYVPKNGFGLHKDGTKLTAFDYEVSFQTRSRDFFGADIEKAKAANDIYALEDILISAYGDLIISGNDDMTSYLYLCRQAVHALSDKVKEQIGDELQKKGGVALALVTELVATSSNAEALFKKAVEPRDDDRDLSGIEAMNEANVVKVFAFLTPSVQTKGILLSNSVNINSPWAQELIGAAPNLDTLVNMNFDTLGDILKTEVSDESHECNKTDESVVHQMYAGMLGQPSAADVPPVRRYVLENGLDLGAAQQLEEDGHDDLSSMTDKDIYNIAPKIKSNVKDLTVAAKLIRARQHSMNDKVLEKTDRYSKKLHATTKYGRKNKTKPMGKKLRGMKLGSAPRKMVSMAGGTSKGGIAKAAVNMLGKGASAGLLEAGAEAGAEALMGPVGIALALAPVLNGIAEDNARRLKQNMAETTADREKASAEVAGLLARVSDISTEEEADKQASKAKELLDDVKRPGSFAFSQMQGLGLQRQLDAMATKFSPSNMAALPPYKSDAELVAAVDCGRALAAVCIFLDDDMPISAPDRQLLQTPTYVRKMGASYPFRTQTHRTTSEKEAMSFVKSTSHSGFSMAKKSVSSSSSSAKIKVSRWYGSAEAKASTASTHENERKASYANDAEHKQQDKVKVTQAVVSEFTFMPMCTFSLSEGGLILSEYAYYRLQNILTSEPVMTYKKALEFLLDFGSHIPFGIQTLGGVFIRNMKITSRESASVTEMYSAASSQLTKTSKEASTSSGDAGVRVGILGVGASANISTSISGASANGETKVRTSSAGVGEGSKEVDASFESTVTCYGPNAATQDMMYQQLMSNNATWTIIDRGEPGSYFAIWDLVDYIGQGGMFSEQCNALREVWEGKALSAHNSIAESDLLTAVMANHSIKNKFFNFIDALIASLVPASAPGIFTGAVADQFEAVVRAAVRCQRTNEVSGDIIQFISAGFACLHSSEPLSGTKRKRDNGEEIITNSNVVRKFEIVPDTPSYHYANISMSEFTSEEWTEFSYYTSIYRSAILEKGKPYYLLNVCRALSEDKSNTSSSWTPLIHALLRPPQVDAGTDADHGLFYSDLERSCQYVETITGRNCLHYVLFSLDKQLITNVFCVRPSSVYMEDNNNKTPFDLARESDELRDSGVYEHLLNLMFPQPTTDIDIALNQPTSVSCAYDTSGWPSSMRNKGILTLGAVMQSDDAHKSFEDPWWQVDLGGPRLITSINIYHLFHNGMGPRGAHKVGGWRVEVYRRGTIVHTYTNDTPEGENPGDPVTITSASEFGNEFVVGDKVRVTYPHDNTFLALRKVEIFGHSSAALPNFKGILFRENCLHHVVFSKDNELITEVFRAYPTNAYVLDDNEKIPLQLASESDDLRESGVCDHLLSLMFPQPNTNLALHQPTSVSSTVRSSGTNGMSSNAVNGILTLEAEEGSGEFTNLAMTGIESNPWWQVDLGGLRVISSICVYNRINPDFRRNQALNGFRLDIYRRGAIVNSYTNNRAPGARPVDHVWITSASEFGNEFVVGDKVRITYPCDDNKTTYIAFREVQIFPTDLSPPPAEKPS